MKLFLTALAAAVFGLGVAWPEAAQSQAANPAIPVANDAGVGAPDEPRIFKGTDKVIEPRAAGSVVQGPASAFKFEDAPISDVAHVMLREVLKADYVLHQPVTGSVTLATRAEVSADQALALLETALQANGLVLARDSRGIYHVGKAEALAGIVATPRVATGGPLPPGSGAVIVPLRFIGAAEMAAILRPLVPAGAIARVDNVRNLLVLVGSRSQAEGWLDMVATFDIDLLKGMSVGVFPLKYATTREIEAALAVLSPAGAQGSARTSTAPQTTPSPFGSRAAQAANQQAAQGAGAATAGLPENFPLYGAIRVLPIERINSVLVVTPRAAYLEEAKRWIDRLDRPSENNNEPRLFVYAVQNGSAKHLADVLNGVYGGEATSGQTTQASSGVAPGLRQTTNTSAGVFGIGQQSTGAARTATGAGAATAGGISSVTLPQGVRVIADETNNALLIYGSGAEYNKIEAALKRMDVAAAQVLIEATIVEVTLTDELRYGLQWAFSDNRSGGDVGTGVLSTLAGGVLGGATQGFSYTLRNSANSVRAVLNALATKSLVKVISSPSLMVLNNHAASIVVGDQQPIRSSETVTDGGTRTSSIQYKDTGVSLDVTPTVNAGNMVTMLINQAVTDVGAEADEATGQRAFLQRRITSKVAVRSGEAIVLGGLIRDNTSSGKAGLPVLQDVPIFGALFGSNNGSTNRTELLVVITPRVVRSDVELRELSQDLRDSMKGLSTMEIKGLPQPVKGQAGEPAADVVRTNNATTP